MIAAGAEGHPDADLARAARHGVGHQAVKSETCEHQSQPAKEAGDGSEQSLPQQRLRGLLPQCFSEENRQITVHRGDFPACLVEQTRGGTVSQLEGNKSPPVLLIPPVLEERMIQDRPRLLARATIERIFHDAHNRGWTQAMTYRILAWKSPAGERFVDDHNRRRSFFVLRTEIPAQEDRRCDGGEVSWAHGVPGHVDGVAVGQLASIYFLDSIDQIELVIHGAYNGGAGGSHLRQRLQPL